MAKCAILLLALWCAGARADLIADWNAIVLDTLVASEHNAARAARAMASVNAAMFDAISFVEGGTPRYLMKQPAPLSGSGEAAAAAAAHYVLSELYPQRADALDAALERSLAAFAPQDRTSARVWGRQLGAIVHTARSAESGPVAADRQRLACSYGRRSQ
jgi:hypothetical protein